MNRIVYNDGTVAIVTGFDEFCNQQVSQVIFSVNDRKYMLQINKSLSDEKLLFIGNAVSDAILGKKFYGYRVSDFYPCSKTVLKNWDESLILRQEKMEDGEDTLNLYENDEWIGGFTSCSLKEIHENDLIKSLLRGLINDMLPEAFKC